MTIRNLESTKSDLVRGFHFNEKQGEGLGDYFLDSIYSDIDSLMIFSGIHPIKFDDYHCILSKRFPFAIYYYVKDEVVFIDAVLDCRQNPELIGKRFDNE